MIRASIVVTTYNRPRILPQCLRSLGALNFPKEDYEVIVVDDHSDQPLDTVVSPYQHGSNLTLVRQPVNSGPGAGRNRGAELAKGGLLVFTDDDCLPDRQWLARLLERHEQSSAAMLGGRIVNALRANPCAEASQVISDLVYGFYNADQEKAHFFSTNNMAVPAIEFQKLGGFNAAFRTASEDREFCDRWRFSGLPLLFVPEAFVSHAHDLNLLSFTRQHFRYGRGAYQYHRLRAVRGSGRITEDMHFHRHLWRLASKRLSGHGVVYKLSMILLLAVWQVANAAGFAWEKLKH